MHERSIGFLWNLVIGCKLNMENVISFKKPYEKPIIEITRLSYQLKTKTLTAER